MEPKCDKQLWLENVLKKLYKKLDSLEAVEKPSDHLSHQKRKLTVSYLNIGNKKRKEEKEEEKEDIDPEIVIEREKQIKRSEKFWNFVDEFIQPKPFHARSKNGFFNSVKVPSTINKTHWINEGITLAFPSRDIRVISDKFTFLGDSKEGFLKTEIDEETTLEERIFLKIQKLRMKKATDAISKEVHEEGILKKSKRY